MFKLQNGLLFIKSYVKVIQGNSIECMHLSWQNPSLPPSSTINTLTAFAARHLTSWLFNFCICKFSSGVSLKTLEQIVAAFNGKIGNIF